MDTEPIIDPMNVDPLINLINYEHYIMNIPIRPKPYCRMTQKSKFVNKSAISYLKYKDDFKQCAKEQIKFFLEKGEPFAIVNIAYIRGRQIGDNDNYLKSTKDSLNKIAYYDDRYSELDLAIRISVETHEEERTEVIVIKL